MSKNKEFEVSQSKAKLWRRCHYAYWLKYVEKLRPKRIKRPFQFGRMVHDMLEAFANGDDPFETLAEIERSQGKMFRVQREEYGEIADDVRVIMTEYFEFYGEKSLQYIRMKGKASEHSFRVELAPNLYATGRLDNIAKTPNKLRWLVEHKSGKNMPNEDERWRNVQSALYTRIIDMLGLPKIDGTCWDFIRSKPPARPQLLKTGKASARQLDSLPLRVIESLKQAKQDPKKFKTLIESTTRNRKRYFSRVFTPVKSAVVKSVFADFVMTAKEIRSAHGELKDKNIGWHCRQCDFEAICRAELTGSDVEFVKQREFMIHDKVEEKEIDFEA